MSSILTYHVFGCWYPVLFWMRVVRRIMNSRGALVHQQDIYTTIIAIILTINENIVRSFENSFFGSTKAFSVSPSLFLVVLSTTMPLSLFPPRSRGLGLSSHNDGRTRFEYLFNLRISVYLYCRPQILPDVLIRTISHLYGQALLPHNARGKFKIATDPYGEKDLVLHKLKPDSLCARQIWTGP